MREIKFRAWDKEAKQMFPVNRIDFMSKGYWIECFGNFVGFVGDRFEPLMQFTGLHDKNGKEIWEGDICDVGNIFNKERKIGHIIWSDGAFYFRFKEPLQDNRLNLVTKCSHSEYVLGESLDSIVKVLGNIYEHPQLLTPSRSE